MNKLILVLGGARSGKSSFAEELSLKLNNCFKDIKDIAYIATGMPVDDEFKSRIINHQNNREKIFTTYEESKNIDNKLEEILTSHNVFLLDCITTWLGNLFHDNNKDVESRALDIVKNIIEKFSGSQNEYNYFDYKTNIIKKNNLLKKEKKGNKIIIIVSNELGLGLVPDDEISRLYRDIHGRINQKLAINSTAFFITLSGIPWRIK